MTTEKRLYASFSPYQYCLFIIGYVVAVAIILFLWPHIEENPGLIWTLIAFCSGFLLINSMSQVVVFETKFYVRSICLLNLLLPRKKILIMDIVSIVATFPEFENYDDNLQRGPYSNSRLNKITIKTTDGKIRSLSTSIYKKYWRQAFLFLKQQNPHIDIKYDTIPWKGVIPE